MFSTSKISTWSLQFTKEKKIRIFWFIFWIFVIIHFADNKTKICRVVKGDLPVSQLGCELCVWPHVILLPWLSCLLLKVMEGDLKKYSHVSRPFFAFSEAVCKIKQRMNHSLLCWNRTYHKAQYVGGCSPGQRPDLILPGDWWQRSS